MLPGTRRSYLVNGSRTELATRVNHTREDKVAGFTFHQGATALRLQAPLSQIILAMARDQPVQYLVRPFMDRPHVLQSNQNLNLHCVLLGQHGRRRKTATVSQVGQVSIVGVGQFYIAANSLGLPEICWGELPQRNPVSTKIPSVPCADIVCRVDSSTFCLHLHDWL